MDNNVTQNIRLLDVFVIGPILIKIANTPTLSPLQRSLLNMIGMGTVLYNGIRYIQEKNYQRGETSMQEIQGFVNAISKKYQNGSN